MDPSPSLASNNLNFDRLSQRIVDGENPQDLLGELVAAVRAGDFTLAGLFGSLSLLVGSGACVATGQKGCAFEILIRNTTSQVKDAMLSGILIDDLLANPDEVPLHMLASHCPIELSIRLSLNPSARVLAGLGKLDFQGRTISHWLWMPDGIMAQHAAEARAAEGTPNADKIAKRWHITLWAVWKLQGLLEDRGIGMDIPDNNGVTALDLCLDRLMAQDAGLLTGQEVCHRVGALFSARQMEAETASASTTHGGLRF